MDWRGKWIDHIGAAAVSATLGFALTMMLCQSLAVGTSPWTVASVCLSVGAICCVGATSKKGAIAAGILAVAFIAVLSLSPVKLFRSVGGLISQVASLYAGGEASVVEYAPTLGVIIGVLLTAFLYWLADMEGGVYPALALCVVLLMCVWLLGRSIDTFYAFVAAAALVCMFARAADDGASYLRAVPSAVIVALLAIALLPSGNPTWPPLESAAQKVRDMFNDYFFFTDPRTTYSISADGFQPMGESLGGPAEPNTGNVMAVETNDTLFLRGSVKRTYTTYAWTESAINSRYVFIDPMRRAVRDDVFDVDLTTGHDVSGAFKRVNAYVTVLSEGISTLFVPHRLINLEIPIDVATYFSTSGEVFITRGVQPSDAYGIEAYIQTASEANMRSLVNSLDGANDDEYESVRQAYTALPSGIEDGVYKLAQSVTKNALTPYDKALAIEKHLIENYKYSLDVKYPPRNKDFVSNFLLKTKKGYCSYFASAMAVMARMVGLPSRYVEGYMVPARASGTTLVTGKNAHAWVEVYFNGLGWITFNPTPGSGDDYSPSGSGGDAGSDSGQDETDGETEPDTEPTPTPTPPPEGGEEGQNDDEEGGQDETPPEDTPSPGEENPDDESDAPEDGSETPPEGDDAAQYPESGEGGNSANWWLILLLLPLAALVLLVIKRLRDSEPRLMTHGMKTTDDKLLTWYRAILLALEFQGQTPNPGETPGQFAERLVKQKLADASFTAVTNQISLNRYAGRRPDATVLRQARQAYAKLVAQLKPMERARWLSHRVIRGIGDIANIP